METLGDRVRALRKAKGLQQTELATCIGTSNSTVSCIEGNRTSPTVELLTTLSKFFGVTLDYLVFGNEQQTVTPVERELMGLIRNNAGLMQSLTNILNESKNISNGLNV